LVDKVRAVWRVIIRRACRALDNAPTESFYHNLKTERVPHRINGTRAKARRDLFQYIEGFYNFRRLHSALATSAQLSLAYGALTPSTFL
jgi:transposase InsO family protein